MRFSAVITPFRRRCPGILAVLLLFLMISIPAASAPEEQRFLIPIANPAEVVFREGDKTEYLLISEAYGVRDSSLISISVLKQSGSRVGIEIESVPIAAEPADTLIMRITMSVLDKEGESSDSSRVKFDTIMIRNGSEPFRAVSDKKKEDLQIDKFFFDPEGYSRLSLPEERVMTPAGAFICRPVEFRKSSSYEINMGGNRAVRNETTRAVLCRSPGVPLWGLVRSEVVRERSTEIDSESIPDGVLNSGRKIYTAVLISFIAAK
ncbi:MAG: hypothetical protein GF417_01560 [Candidatus Latescibacteria bacterium]|nr:hypothetical protein [bacterium]MBD3423113.1 hypothetical protein [Candidatus Latescibacterota bacterium]